MAAHRRIVWGHALTGIGLLIRRAALPLAILALVGVLLTGMGPGSDTVARTLVIGVPLLAFIGSRVLAVAVAAVGWVFFPPTYRAVLGNLASPHAGRTPPNLD